MLGMNPAKGGSIRTMNSITPNTAKTAPAGEAEQEPWEYILEDYMDLSCSLKEEDQKFLIGEIKREKLKADRIEIIAAFIVEEKIVIIPQETRAEECWIYFPGERKIERHCLKK